MPTKKETTKRKTVKKVKKEKTSSKGVSTEIVCVIDRSGSMDSIKGDAIGGFNNFLNEQKKLPGAVNMTIIQFDNEYMIMCSGKPIAEVEPLTEKTYQPRGSTALLDAIGRSISEVNQRNPEKAIIVILTDGQENSSNEYTKQGIKLMIAECEKKGWVVIYLSAHSDAFKDAHSVGVPMNNVMSFKSDAKGANTATMSASYAAGDYRKHGRLACGMSAYSSRASHEYDTIYKNKTH